MCGIAGVFFRSREGRDQKLAAFEALVKAHQHARGPDEFNSLKVGGDLYLFHNMLAIIDPGRAQQPMKDERGAITFNGEIYNYAQLKFDDETYRMTSDTEVLLKGLHRQGVDFLRRTHSMFGFGYVDFATSLLTLARDRMGVKQVYYIDNKDVFAFASTIAPLMMFSEGEVNAQGVFDYYLNRAIKAPRTLFRDIHELGPGHYLTFDTRKGELRGTARWWSLEPKPRLAANEAELIEELDRDFRDSIKHRLVADVPVAAFLSGGVDSSLMVAVARESIPNLETFTVAMPDRRLDESDYAAKIAAQYGLKHHVIRSDPDAFASRIEEWALLQDDMVADPSALTLHEISLYARDRGFRVMLSGEGADEAFGGYNAQGRYALSLRYHRLFAPFRPAAGLADRAFARNSKMRQFIRQLLIKPAYHGVAIIFEPVVLEDLFLDRWTPPASAETFADAIFRDLTDRLPNDLLTRTDRATMAASIEARVPFLSHHLIEKSLHIREDLLMKGFTQKYILKKLAEKYIPHENIYRRKIGFDLPLANWFRHTLRPMLYDAIDGSWQRSHINLKFIRQVADLHCSGQIDASDKLWAFLMLELNYRKLDDIRRTYQWKARVASPASVQECVLAH